MIQLIGLIIAVYAVNATLTRLLQMHATESETFFGLPSTARLILAAVLAAGTVMVLAALTAMLLATSLDVPKV